MSTSFYVYETHPDEGRKITPEQYEQAESNGISRSALRKRVKLNWSMDRAINTPILTQKEVTERAAAATPFRETNKLHFLKEGAK